ncbi:MAG TPA: hypothetical protein VES67_08350 [Vicinamibacterales bacterium]|nr:hypothetical protein [Vicinamibacterales bacterium]
MTAATLLRSAGILAVALLGLSACSRGEKASGTGPGAELRALTGAPARAVWVQGDGTDPRAAGDQLILMGLDTQDGRGERIILNQRRSYVKPMFTPKGNRIVFSSRVEPGPPEVFIVNWDGTGLRTLSAGFGLAVWENPVDQSEWMYVGSNNTRHDFATVTRFPIDAPDKRELVWNASLVSMDTFQVSADGRFAGGLFPWPHAGIADLRKGTVTRLGDGCWPGLARVRGPLFWYFDGAHRNLTMVDVAAESRWMVNINAAPGFDGAEVYHPRWTNHPRFMTISGPYNQGGPNQARTGGPQVEVYLGRFSQDFSQIEAWARVTNNSGGDSYPDVWIDVARSPHAKVSGPIGPMRTTASKTTASHGPPDATRLVASVRLTQAGPIPTPESILPYRSALVVNDYEVVEVRAGTYTERTIKIAQWAIRDGRVLPTARKTAGAAFTLTVERYDAHPELEGERLIATGAASSLPLYYDIGR